MLSRLFVFALMIDAWIDFVLWVVWLFTFNSVACYTCVYFVRIFCCVLFAYVLVVLI